MLRIAGFTGVYPIPHKLLKKFTQNFTRNRANARFPFLVFGQAFFKKLAGVGGAHGFAFTRQLLFMIRA